MQRHESLVKLVDVFLDCSGGTLPSLNFEEGCLLRMYPHSGGLPEVDRRGRISDWNDHADPAKEGGKETNAMDY